MKAFPQTSLAVASTVLFVPANRPERLAKAMASGADAVIVDLEDALAPSDKVHARLHITPAFAAREKTRRARLVVRIHAAGTPWYDDLALMADSLPRVWVGFWCPRPSLRHHWRKWLRSVVIPVCSCRWSNRHLAWV